MKTSSLDLHKNSRAMKRKSVIVHSINYANGLKTDPKLQLEPMVWKPNRSFSDFGNVELNWPKLFQAFSVKFTLIVYHECVHSIIPHKHM